MLIKSIKLHNIRSYESQEINFPSGSVLLAGDIGSGKSTILLAIEFAIFGAKKRELPAYTLLRHGKKEGSVELRMLVDNKDVIIKRTLKRSSEDIKQEAGYVVTNGMKKDGTSEELRAIVLNLLGYPRELIKKGKDFIYRYTVYTPQEEMKQIIYESKEARLDTLRKVFNIDKYKRIRDNSKILASAIREKRRHIEGFIIDLEYKKNEMEEKKNEMSLIEKEVVEINPKIEDIKKAINEKKESIKNIEKEINELNHLRKELSIAETSISHKIDSNNKLNDEIKKLERQIEEQKKELESKTIGNEKDIIKKITEKEKDMSEIDLAHKNAIRAIREIEVEIKHCNDTIKKVSALEICPLCEQKVDENHKHEISSRESKKYEQLMEQAKSCKEEELKLEKVKSSLKKEIDSLIKEQSLLSVVKIRLGNINEKISLKEEKSNLKEQIKKEICHINAQKLELSSKIERYKESEESYNKIKKEIDELLPQERFLELEKRKYETEKESIKRFIASLGKEIDEKQKAKEKLAHIMQISNWIDELFISLMSTMEKHVMVNIHSQFNEMFKSWFEIMIEDESISVRLDEEFTPIIEQNGYETYIENLSGGEKTSVALSYRLALNKVINDIVAGIKTKDIIILDEPTDGFSTEQLDRVRDILEQLNMNQIIIVSHESKIESFVQNVIRIEKHDNISGVV